MNGLRMFHRVSLGLFAMLVLQAQSGPIVAEEPTDGKTANPFAAAIAQAQRRTVKIFGAGVGRAEGYATGLIVSADGRILTANSVILTGERIRVIMHDGKTHNAKLERRDVAIQTAVLKIDAATPDFFSVLETLPAKKGDWVLCISNAFKVAEGEEALSVNLGILSLVTRVDTKRGTQDVPYEGEAVLIDAVTSNAGAPGGAVVTADGRLVGMIGRLLESKQTKVRLNYAVPSPLLAKLLAGKPTHALAANGNAPTGVSDLGIRLFTLGGKRAPAYVDRVLPDSPAAAIGLKSDDLVLSIGGKRIRTVADFETAISTLSGDGPLELLVKRKQKLLRLQLTPKPARAKSPK